MKVNHIDNVGIQMYSLMERLFPICRSLTGDGNRETLNIIKEYIPIELKEEQSGEKVFDWEIPNEWNIKDAYVKDSDGIKVVDFKENNLHVLGYSEPFEGKIKLEELNKHLFSLPDQPDLIPYVTSYYEKRWGFCLTHNQRKKLKKGIYEVKIDSTLEPGHLTYGELIINGLSDKEIFISTYICHPSMANNELSGPVVATYLADHIQKAGKPYYTYRFIFIPETIGSIVYLSNHYKELAKKVKAGYVITCIGDSGKFSYLQTRSENQLVDRVTIHVLKHSKKEFNIYDFLSRGSDERQYNAPGIDLPIGSLMRTKHGEYPEYHTSGDNLDIITPQSLKDSLEMYEMVIDVFENNHKYQTTVLCEPHLGKRGLYPTISTKTSNERIIDMMNIIAYCDGDHDLLWIAEKMGKPIFELFPIIDNLINHDLIIRVD